MPIFKRNIINEPNEKVCLSHNEKYDFSDASCWHYDRYESQLVQANRWLLAFWCQTALSLLLMISFCCLLPLKTLVPLVIHQNSQTHEVFVDKLDKHYIPHQHEIESDLVRYVILRETYSAIDLPLRYKQVLLTSNKDCALDYQQYQANTNLQSPINLFGNEGIRTVHVEDVVFLTDRNSVRSTEEKHNLAKVDFVTTETMHHQSIKKSWVATISWEYRGTPEDKEAAWQNWNGFTVTYYRIDQRSIEVERS